jgi:hypothetical protein
MLSVRNYILALHAGRRFNDYDDLAFFRLAEFDKTVDLADDSRSLGLRASNNSATRANRRDIAGLDGVLGSWQAGRPPRSSGRPYHDVRALRDRIDTLHFAFFLTHDNYLRWNSLYDLRRPSR